MEIIVCIQSQRYRDFMIVAVGVAELPVENIISVWKPREPLNSQPILWHSKEGTSTLQRTGHSFIYTEGSGALYTLPQHAL